MIYRLIPSVPVSLLSHVHPRLSARLFSSQVETEVKSVRNSKGMIYETDFKNEAFEKFYRAQAVCDEAEFPALLAACRRGLPSVFRVVTSRPNHQLIVQQLRAGQLAGLGARPVPWCRDQLVWRLDTTRWDLVDTDSEETRRLHRWIVEQDRLGNIYRQEQVSTATLSTHIYAYLHVSTIINTYLPR